MKNPTTTPKSTYGTIELDCMDPEQLVEDAKSFNVEITTVNFGEKEFAKHGMPTAVIKGERAEVWKFIKECYDDDFSIDDFVEFFKLRRKPTK